MKDSVKRMEEIADQFDKWLARADPLNVFASSHGFARAAWIDAHGGASSFLTAPEARWIPVAERLPDADMPVVIVEPHTTWGDEKPSEGGVMSFAIFKGGEFKVDRLIGSNAEPSHWMPLPLLPQVNEP